jgi:hypothetical protein
MYQGIQDRSGGQSGEKYGSLGVDSGSQIMQWTTPQMEEISLNCEINSYASARL